MSTEPIDISADLTQEVEEEEVEEVAGGRAKPAAVRTTRWILAGLALAHAGLRQAEA